MSTDLAADAPIVVDNDDDNDDNDLAPRWTPSSSTSAVQNARDLVATSTSHAASFFAAASRSHLSAATQDLLLAKRVNSSIASAASTASDDLAGWSDLRDALAEKLAALGTLSAESINRALEPRVEALQREADELDALSKKLARAVGVSSVGEGEDDDEEEDDDGSESERESKLEKKKKTPSSSSSSATAAATAAASAASAAATAASAAASKLWSRWAPVENKRRS